MGNLVARNLALERDIPLSKSCGGINNYRVPCKRGVPSSYGVCQNVVKAFVKNRLNGFDDCKAMIKDRTCVAMKMMAKERKEGKCLWYDEYIPPSARIIETVELPVTAVSRKSEGFKRGWDLAGRKSKSPVTNKKTVKAVKKTKVTKEATKSGNDLADLVNKMTSEEQAKKAASKEQSSESIS